ncbi:MAG: SDR family oxidoreductase [Pirellulaceae bacterium]|nr:SDR family oxidoreductase [Planctomycetaceae bacterium]
MTKYLVTGGAGFIGSHIVSALIERGETVRVIDNLSTGRLANLEHIEGAVDFIRGDIGDLDVVRDAVSDIDIVFHQAALASVPLSVEDPLATHHACVTGTLNILHAAQQAKVQRVVYAASSSLYGDQPTSSKREVDTPDPLSPYGVAKLAAEYYCHAFYHTYGLETVCLRYFNVFGPRQDPDSAYSAVIPLFITAMLQGKGPTIYGDGLQSRDFTFVENVVQGNLLAAEQPSAPGKSYNIANGRATDLLTLIHTLNQLLGTDIAPQHEPARAGDIRDSMADVTRARQDLGYDPQVGFAEGLERSISYYRDIVSASSTG